MNRYEISNEFRKRFVDENKNVWGTSIKPYYFSINGEEVIASSNPYLMENSEHGLVIFTYAYTVINNTDCSMVPLFFCSNGRIEDYIIIDEWKLYFSPPKTATYKCYTTYVYMEKGDLYLDIPIKLFKLEKEIPAIWKLFSMVRKCTSKLELDYVKTMYQQGIEINELKSKNFKQAAEIEALNIQINAYKSLLDKIEKLISPI